ncbi:hypothetical protein CJ178_05600 [Rhodococcus sp. ACPA4]|jgi:UPF0716 protein FxsA|uniref:UPF0716 protein FxsA n=1 Tax=Nocardia globerula TaxID=1818 RepID=A0A652YMT5_NOCGL|nr:MULTISPECIES: FxsA family protein [Rhodococcus]NMD62375.1 FxsA family protein [Nocardia globerula]KJF22866.1 phage T7 F exclusion suppressor FxsA [Rhodococcus sp. AD45]MCE4263758.1 FxsA family protein [Rhodococcus globerulus]NRI64640.1 FxsA family protein [Rhodococcus sp. MS16]PBC41140.1 hypothetical protein CJ178_05600 [Rhodococcus sp. ACPA4]
MIAAMFLLYVIVEIAALVIVGNAIGIAWTILLFLAGSLVGMVLMRSQWRKVMDGFRKATRGEGSPSLAVADGALVATGSALMFVPGLVTSVLGLLLLIPPTRWALRPLAVLLAGRRAAAFAAGGDAFAGTVGYAARMRGNGEVIDGEIIVETPTATTEYVASNGKELVLEGEILDTDTPTRSRGPQY